jgi:hypothetical protein
VTPEAQPAAAPADAMLDLIRLVQSVLRRSKRYWAVIPATLVLAVVGFVVAPRVRPPVYRSEVVVALRDPLDAGAVLANQQGGGENTRTRNARLQALVFSRPNLRALIEYEKIEPTEVARIGMARVVEYVQNFVNFSAGEGNTFVLQYASDDPGLSQRAARRLGQLLVDRVAHDASEQAVATRKFLEDETAKLAESLHAQEAEYAEFVALHPEFALDTGQNQNQVPGYAFRAAATAAASGNAPADPASALRRQADRLRSRLAQIANPSLTAGTTAAANPETQLTPESREAIASAQADVRRAQEELAAGLAKYTPRHPDVVAAHARVSAAEQRLKALRAAAQRTALPAATASPGTVQPETQQELQRQLRSVEATIQSDRASVATSGNATGSRSADAIVGLETRWSALKRAVESQREQYESMQRRLFNAILIETAQATGGGSQMVVVQDADFPKQPSARDPKKTSAVTAAVIVVLGLAVMLGLGFLDPRIMSQWDLERLNLAPVALYIPRVPAGAPGSRHG